jgi:hypothetical protein
MEKEINHKGSSYLIRAGEGDFRYWITCFKNKKKIIEFNISVEDEMDCRSLFQESLVTKQFEFIENLILKS